jgi:signal transduction histidine kinase
MISFSRLLTLSYLAIILTGIVLAAPLAWLSLEQAYLDNQQTNLLAQAQLIAQTLQSSTQPPPVTPYSQQNNTLAGFHTHIIETGDLVSTAIAEEPLPVVYTSMIGVDGPVVIGLQTTPPTDQQLIAPLPYPTQSGSSDTSAQELLSRPEIVAAFSGQPATAIRTVLENHRVLYAAAPIVSAEGVVQQIVYMTTPLPKSGWAALAPSSRWQIVGLIGFMVAFTGLIGWRFARSLAQSLGQIVTAARQVAAGDLNSQVSTPSAVSDLHSLSQAFNEMTESLRQADQAKMAFVADVSHELRTPLTVIKGTVETLQDGALDDLQVREGFLTSIAEETDRLIALVNGLLTLARADGGALKLQLAPFNLAELAQARVAYMQGIAAEKGMGMQLRIRGTAELPTEDDTDLTQDDCWVLADAQRITQVLDNLLDNAIRYTQFGDEVQVIVTPGKEQITCRVVDTGPGIAAHHLPLLFNRFYRVEASRNRRLGGSGLGLAISQEIIKAHGGSITVQSTEGQGTTLTFTLPATQNCS